RAQRQRLLPPRGHPVQRRGAAGGEPDPLHGQQLVHGARHLPSRFHRFHHDHHTPRADHHRDHRPAGDHHHHDHHTPAPDHHDPPRGAAGGEPDPHHGQHLVHDARDLTSPSHPFHHLHQTTPDDAHHHDHPPDDHDHLDHYRRGADHHDLDEHDDHAGADDD